MVEKLYIIKKDQLSFLIKNLLDQSVINKLKNFNSEILIINDSQTNRCQISLNDVEVSSLLDELTLLLTSEGLKLNDEPNDFGLLIESLIDIFSRHCI